MSPKRGDLYESGAWRDTGDDKPLVIKVTSVRQGVVHWRGVSLYDGERWEANGSLYYTPILKFTQKNTRLTDEAFTARLKGRQANVSPRSVMKEEGTNP